MFDDEKVWRFLRDKLGIESRNPLYLEALTHNVHDHIIKSRKDNDRLAFVGDLILNASIGIHCYRENAHWDEGRLSRRCAELRSNKSFARISERIGLVVLIRYADKPDSSMGVVEMRAKALEALFGAIYLDHGFEKAREIAERVLFF